MKAKAVLLEFEPLLRYAKAMYPDFSEEGGTVKQDFEVPDSSLLSPLKERASSLQIETRLDMKMIAQAKDVLEGKAKSVKIVSDIHNVDRTFGATLSHEISM